ncbi:hypothetical protein LTS10_000331 [Elasticomyces elasticus]|nr:hypothetical protein LTS10_000331 [Elasticomyces elasticus]
MRDISLRQLYPQIIRTCHQINDEAKATLYTPDHVVLDPSVRKSDVDDEHEGRLDRRPFVASCLHHIRSLKSLEVRLCTSAQSHVEDLAFSQCLAETLHNTNRIGAFALHVSDPWLTVDDAAIAERLLGTLEGMIKIWTPLAKATGSRVQVTWSGGCDLTWLKDEEGNWYESPESEIGDEYRASGRAERLLAAVSNGSTGVLT